MKVLVTGGAGFIGSHVVEALLGAGHEVCVVDDLSSGRREHLSPDVRLHVLDIADAALAEVFDAERPDAVSHQAAQPSVAVSVREPLADARVNVLGTLNLITQAVRTGVRRFVFASTGGAIYGECEALPVTEAHPARPISPYGVHKLCAEHHLFAAQHLYGLRWTALRYANVYGPRQDPHGEAGVVAIFTRAMLAGQTPTIFGDGLHTRDYVYVGDVAAANAAALAADADGVFNIGTGTETSTQQVFDTLKAQTGYWGEPRYGPPRPGDVRRIALDVSRAEQALGWRPTVSLDEGLRRTVEWFRRAWVGQ
ncbi:MAG: GDP-mannose 4,6-dehydratase [Armatimonadota bacterium]|nr:GDP-mannose 4,6-dehydratase [Armatimonadota bacterium]MDR5697168.1 GDP-mannose 4,6-dehydratase [Armatimonadota bacterium]